MQRLTALVLLSAVLGAGPASAMRAHDYLDADQRGPVTLPAERPTVAITVADTSATPATPAADAQLAPPEQQSGSNAVATPVLSPVPEPSGLAMLASGLLLLLLAPFGRDADQILPELVKRPGSSL